MLLVVIHNLNNNNSFRGEDIGGIRYGGKPHLLYCMVVLK